MKIKINIISKEFVDNDGTFNMNDALQHSGRIAGICYSKNGYNFLKEEDEEKTKKRINQTLDNGHHSVYDHVHINLDIINIPKILAMVINNEHQYDTSEKSLRYTKILPSEDSIISDKEITLYNKWLNIFKIEIEKLYGDIFSESKIAKLAQENARYLISVFIPTEMIYTTSLRQLNYIASWMREYISGAKTCFEKKLSLYMTQFIEELNKKSLLEERLMKNEKHRRLSLFGHNLDLIKDYFGDVYSTTYYGSFAELAQAQRHRTIDYQMEINDKKEYFIPPLIASNDNLTVEWISDMKDVSNNFPQGMLIKIHECGKYDDFILKCMERLCSHAQLEIMLQTKKTLEKYKNGLVSSGNPKAEDIKNYCKVARCTFPNYRCDSPCHFKEGINLNRKI